MDSAMDYAYDYNSTYDYNSADSYACAPECTFDFCESGDYCTVTTCVDPCTNATTCTQDYFNQDGEWVDVDCSEGIVVVERVCEEYCEYDDCSEERGITC